MMQLDPQEFFLEDYATLEQQWQALSLNNQSWFARIANSVGKEVVTENGMMWTRNHIAISAVNPLEIGEQLDRAMVWYRSQSPVEGAICWYLSPDAPGDLAAWLFARGFETNWQPHWMWCSLRELVDRPSPPENVRIEVAEDEPIHQPKRLPYYSPEKQAARVSLQQLYPQQVQSLVAYQKKRVVGRCMLNITTGELGMAGLFSMAVVPSARNQGIGRALVWEACDLARQIGCRHVMLNATAMGEPVYRRVGFRTLAHSPSWFMREETLTALALTTHQVRFLEAIGMGEIVVLDELVKQVGDTFFQQPLPNSMTALDIAVHCQKPVSAQWLINHGVSLDLLSAWDIGWRERVLQLLHEQPELVNVQSGEGQLTPLHVAVERNDIELVDVLLSVPNNLDLKDKEYQSTALGWAQHFDRKEIVMLLEHHDLGTKG